jgi:rod shape-determining protein MreD
LTVPRFVLGLAIAVAALVQAAVLPDLILVQVRPNLVLVLVLLWTITRGAREGALWAFGAGLFLDLLTLAPLGVHALALLSVVGVSALARSRRFSLGLLLPMAAALAATLVHDGVLLALQGSDLATIVASLLRLSLLTGMLNLMIVPVIFFFTAWLARWVAQMEETFGRPRPRPAGRTPRR